eukprot:763135-Hanusia_phi.AAC.5
MSSSGPALCGLIEADSMRVGDMRLYQCPLHRDGVIVGIGRVVRRCADATGRPRKSPRQG